MQKVITFLDKLLCSDVVQGLALTFGAILLFLMGLQIFIPVDPISEQAFHSLMLFLHESGISYESALEILHNNI